MILRTRLLNTMAQNLMQHAENYNLAVHTALLSYCLSLYLVRFSLASRLLLPFVHGFHLSSVLSLLVVLLTASVVLSSQCPLLLSCLARCILLLD